MRRFRLSSLMLLIVIAALRIEEQGGKGSLNGE
jgi:hypothetical protein